MIKSAIREGVIEPEELQELLSTSTRLPDGGQIKIVDGTFVLPTSSECPYQSFCNERIDGAVFFDINQIADKNTSLPHMLPSAPEFEHAVSNLGISNNDLIVVYGQSGMVMGPARVWWMFKTFGHTNVCVLNGGLPAWKSLGYELNTTPNNPPEKTEFKAATNPKLVCDLQTIQNATQGINTASILDARPENRFNGSTPEPRSELRKGHMPTSKNLPCVNLIDTQNGRLKSKEEIRAILKELGHQQGTSIITTCGSGVTACMIMLALYNVGISNASVYDGSWSEWGQESLPTTVLTNPT